MRVSSNHAASDQSTEGDLPDPIRLFGDYLRVTGVAHTMPEPSGDRGLIGKRVGLVHGSSWVTLWANYFGRRFLPGAHLINVGNEAVQINFMEAHAAGRAVPPQANIDAFVRYAADLIELARVDAVMLTCSTMNRGYRAVQEAVRSSGVPIVQIDEPMMRRAVEIGGRVLVVATHGPTVSSTQALLRETADETGRAIEFGGATVEDAWHQLAAGDVQGHNRALAEVIHREIGRGRFDSVVLAQLSMSALLFSYPEPEQQFGIPVLSSAQCGFERLRELLTGRSAT